MFLEFPVLHSSNGLWKLYTHTNVYSKFQYW